MPEHDSSLEEAVLSVCSLCWSPLRVDAGTWTCAEGHAFTALTLALSTNTRALKAVWAAVRALEDDAAALEHLAAADDMAALASAARRREAAAALDAAVVLREHALAAQQRVAALDEDSGAGRQPL